MGKRHTAFDVGMATAETLAHRMPILWWNVLAPSAAGNAEISKMVVEKQHAFIEGMAGAQAEIVKLAMTPWWLWHTLTPHGSAQRISDAATDPSSRRVKANAKRLRSKA
jgi:hypothetical protein